MQLRYIPLLFLVTACATTGATYRSGVGDALLQGPPYYAGARTAASAVGARVGIFPVQFQPGGGQPALFDPAQGPMSPTAQLLREMNDYLDSLLTSAGAPTVRIITSRDPVRSMPPDRDRGVAPDVRFGCATELGLPGEDCAERGDSALGRARQEMKLSVGRPSAEWVAWAGDAMDAAGTAHALVITLEVGQYLTKQRGLAGRKSVQLGTGHEQPLPWMTSLETPVTVLQLTGALVDHDGRAVRIGAEGIVAARTPLLASGIGAQRILGDQEIATVRTQRRNDLAAHPLAWQEAMRQLARQLTR
jgi:hypothetical protein